MTLRRGRFTCRRCGVHAYPLDDRLGVDGLVSPHTQRLLCIAEAERSFERASRLLRELDGLNVCDNTISDDPRRSQWHTIDRGGVDTVLSPTLAADLPLVELVRARATRHRIENGGHWTLGVTFREDESRIREEHLHQNMAWLNRFSLSLLKQVPDRKSVAARRRSCGWSDEYFMQAIV